MPFKSEKDLAVLNLLTLTILADKVVRQAEIKSFVETSLALGKKIKFEEEISGARLLTWFDSNHNRIWNRMNGNDFQKWFLACLDTLRDIEGKEHILNSMTKIAHSDDEIHVGEVALINITARHWNLQERDVRAM